MSTCHRYHRRQVAIPPWRIAKAADCLIQFPTEGSLVRTHACHAFLAAASSLILLANPQPADADEPQIARPPNIVYLLADDLGYGEAGCYGQTRIATPRIDALAAQGMRFTRHYSGAPVCAPARCVLMTGMHAGHATIRDNLEHQPEGQEPIFKDDITIAEVLKARGYATGCFGKWGLGYPGSEGDPLQQGFERFFGYNCQRHAHNHYPRYLWSNDTRLMLGGNQAGLTGRHYAHDLIVKEALTFIRAHAAGPFFCYVPFTLPHLALQVPDDSLAPYRDAFPETPYDGNSYLPHPTPRAAYAAMISRLDRGVGQIVDLLHELGLDDQTLVMFSSDNGPTHLKEQVDYDFFDSTGGLRGLKGSVYEGGIRVPLIARWPGSIAAGSTSDHICGFQDILPTFAQLAGADDPPDIDGISFAPTLLGKTDAQRLHPWLLWDFPGYGGQLAVREGRWKAVRRNLRQHPDAPLELYDLDVDPNETTDVASQHPDVAARLASILRENRTAPAYESLRFGDYTDQR